MLSLAQCMSNPLADNAESGICEDEFGASVNDFGNFEPRFEHEHACRPPPAQEGSVTNLCGRLE